MADLAGQALTLSGSGLSTLMTACLEKGAGFRFRARGSSMTPFIRDGDILTVSGAPDIRPQVGDVAAVINPATGTVIVHRIVREKGTAFCIKGDNCRHADGFFDKSTVTGVIVKAERHGRPVRFGLGPEKRMAALLSRTGLLTYLLLPLLRKIRPLFP